MKFTTRPEDWTNMATWYVAEVIRLRHGAECQRLAEAAWRASDRSPEIEARMAQFGCPRRAWRRSIATAALATQLRKIGSAAAADVGVEATAISDPATDIGVNWSEIAGDWLHQFAK